MNRLAVRPEKSSAIRSIGYDAAACVLEVEFASGGVYAYAGVPKDTYKEFIHAASLGQYVATMLRGNFSVTRVHEEGCNAEKECNETCGCWCHRPAKKTATASTASAR